MEFEEAIRCLKKGERIKRSHWRSAYLMVENKRIKMCMRFRKPWAFVFKDYDIFATDWLIDTSLMYVDDDNEYANLKPLNFN